MDKDKEKIGWQNEYVFYNLLFKTPSSLSRETLKSIFILNKLSVLDPGLVSDREIDEELLNSLRRGAKALVSGVSSKGTTTKDTFSLSINVKRLNKSINE